VRRVPLVRGVVILPVVIIAVACSAETQPSNAPTPQSIDEFQQAATRVLHETGVPGAGIALVRQDGVEWEGGLGFADRDRQTPVTADTHFRVGSISKTFVALAMVQLYEDGLVDLHAPIEEIAPEIRLDNRWHETHPVRVINLLEHTAGFDDMHFNAMYVSDDRPDLSLEQLLALTRPSLRVRWPASTRMAYSNPGYGVAALLLEKISGVPYEDYIKREIFDPLEMSTSSFRLTAEDERLLAHGYSGRIGPPVGFSRIYIRPAGNMHSSARELARFVRMLVNWGELGTAFVVDPEYLSNMEHPTTTLAAAAGLRQGYGSGIGSILDLPYPLLGHGGGIDGFVSQYAYSPSRDVGFVILLNSAGSGAGNAMTRLSSLAISYLKRDVERPQKAEAHVDAASLGQYVGYYHDANPRNQVAWPVQTLLSGQTISVEGQSLYATPVVGRRVRLIPLTETSFRLEHQVDASRVFTQDANGVPVLAGPGLYAERRPRWRVELTRIPTLLAVPMIASVFVAAIIWIARLRHARPRGFWGLKMVLLLCPLAVIAPIAAVSLTPMREWGTRNAATVFAFLATLAVPLLAALVIITAVAARRAGAGRWLTSYALLVAAAMSGLSIYLGAHGYLGFRTWTY
jgi:CubicO group peptidase (beta-lactamase class C family)